MASKTQPIPSSETGERFDEARERVRRTKEKILRFAPRKQQQRFTASKGGWTDTGAITQNASPAGCPTSSFWGPSPEA